MPDTSTSRGGGWVVGQFVILATILIVGYFDPERTTDSIHLTILGILWGSVSIGVMVLAFSHLGRNLTPFPKPLDDGELVTHGIYAFVRHPIYLSVICASVSYSIFMGSALALIGCVILTIWFDRKAAREEAFLRAKFAEYDAYARKVAKFFPGIY